MMDTPNKRASAIGIALAIRLVLPGPDGTLDQADRQQVAYSYAGILSGSPVPIPLFTRARGVMVRPTAEARGVKVVPASGSRDVLVEP